MATATLELEQVTPNVFTTTKLRGCNPSFVVDVGRRRRHRHAAAADAGRGDARGGGDARPDPLPHQHREPRRPHLRQLVVPGRGRGRQPPGPVRHLHGPERGARPVRLRARGDPDRRSRGARRSSPTGTTYYADLPRGHGRVHRRPDAAGRRPHVPLPVDARPHARASSRSTCPRSGGLHRRHDLQRVPDLADDLERRPVARGARADPRSSTWTTWCPVTGRS